MEIEKIDMWRVDGKAIFYTEKEAELYVESMEAKKKLLEALSRKDYFFADYEDFIEIVESLSDEFHRFTESHIKLKEIK